MFEVIIAGALNFKMAASGFVSVTKEVMNMIKKIQFQIAQMMLVLVWSNTFQKKDMKFLLIEFDKPIKF